VPRTTLHSGGWLTKPATLLIIGAALTIFLQRARSETPPRLDDVALNYLATVHETDAEALQILQSHVITLEW
jgi:hypothetical protein